MVMIMATDRLRQTLNVGKLPLFEAFVKSVLACWYLAGFDC